MRPCEERNTSDFSSLRASTTFVTLKTTASTPSPTAAKSSPCGRSKLSRRGTTSRFIAIALDNISSKQESTGRRGRPWLVFSTILMGNGTHPSVLFSPLICVLTNSLPLGRFVRKNWEPSIGVTRKIFICHRIICYLSVRIMPPCEDHNSTDHLDATNFSRLPKTHLGEFLPGNGDIWRS